MIDPIQSMTPLVTPRPALVAFFMEANRLADVARERAGVREHMSLFAVVVDTPLPLTLLPSKHSETYSTQSARLVSAEPKSTLPGGIRPKPTLPRNLLVMQFNSRPQLPRQKLTFRVGR